LQYPHTITNPHEGIARRLTSTILIKQSESEYGEDDRLAVSLAMVRNQQDHKLLEEFEQGFAKFVGTDYCLFTINRSSAISLALRSLGLEKRDEVIIPVCASTTLLSGVMSIGALPRFVDVNREDGNIDASQLRLDDASKVKALVAVHTNGRSCKTQSLLELACKNGWQIIEDASEAIGSRCDGKHLGTSANLGLIGFQRFSLIGLDHGAVLVTSDKKVLDRLASERDRDLAPSEIQAALALSQLRKLRETIDRKRQLTRIYYELLDEAKLTAL
jgi:perosamine synthetase